MVRILMFNIPKYLIYLHKINSNGFLENLEFNLTVISL